MKRFRTVRQVFRHYGVPKAEEELEIPEEAAKQLVKTLLERFRHDISAQKVHSEPVEEQEAE